MLARLRKFMVAPVMVFAAMMAMAQSTAQSSTDVYLSAAVTENGCSAGEPVALTGNMHFTSSYTTDADGVNHITISVANDLGGLGQNSGGQYAAKDSSDYSVNSSDSSAELTANFKSDLTTSGSMPSLELVQTLHMTTDINGNITATVDKNATKCGQ